MGFMKTLISPLASLGPKALVSPAWALLDKKKKKPEAEPTLLHSRSGDFSRPDTKQLY